MLPCPCGISSAEEKKPGFEYACDQLTHQLTANKKCKLPQVLEEEACRARSTFLWVEGLGSWDDFNEHPQWDPSGGVLGGQSGWRKQMALRPLAICWSISREESEGRDERERVRERKNQQAQTQTLDGLLWKRNLGEQSSVYSFFKLHCFFALLVSILMFSFHLREQQSDNGRWDLQLYLQDALGLDTYCTLQSSDI